MTDKGELAGKVAVVTGAAGGIGTATAHVLAREGAAVALLDIDAARATETARSVRDAGGTAIAHTCDVTDENAVDAAFRHVRDELGVPDVLVNNAGIAGPDGDALDTTISEFDRCMAVNVRSMFVCARRFIGGFRDAGKNGAIVNVASVNAVFAEPGYAAYIASKGAVTALTRALALHHIADGVRVNCVCPGAVDTEMGHPDGTTDEDMQAFIDWPRSAGSRAPRRSPNSSASSAPTALRSWSARTC